MKIESYMDENILAADHTLVRFIGNDTKQVIVPSHVGNLELTDIGSGAVVINRNITNQLIIDNGYIRLAADSLLVDTAVTVINIPHTVREINNGFLRINSISSGERLCIDEIIFSRLVNRQHISHLQNSGMEIFGGKRIYTSANLGTSVFEPVHSAAFSLGSIPVLHPDMCFLFYAGKAKSIFDTRSCLDLQGKVNNIEEYTAVMDMIQREKMGWRDPEAERISDFSVRTGSRQNQESALWLAESDPENWQTIADDQYMIEIRLRRLSLFTPALLQVRYQHKTYYLYSRLHLNSLNHYETVPYWREDVCIFDKDGLISDQNLSENVYAKARFLMLL